ncbi:MAG: hypothetical protein L6422_11340 [Candidatus Marinimicrobia bacterium]|nr:hypothetical protein [bacterium]MCG2716840.1 hypothetical protein [Candidatus Neomarinimicrobiota bacterium]
MNLARAIIDGVVDSDEDIAKRIFACTECGACPTCQTNLLDAARKSGIQLRILDVTELLSQVL